LGFETISSRLSEDSSTIDLNTNNLEYKQVLKVEEFANQIVYNNLDVKIYFVHEQDISKIPLRKPPKYSGEIRIVEVDSFDYSACGGTHCKKTGEVGIIKIRKWEKVKGNLTRLEFYCGKRALNDYQWKNQIVLDLASSLTVKDTELNQKVLKIIDDNKNLSKKFNLYRSQLLDYEAEKLFKDGIVEKDIRIIKKIFRSRDVGEIRILIQKALSLGECVALIGIMDEQSNVIFARSNGVNQNMLQLLDAVSSIVGIKGGGKSDFVQAFCFQKSGVFKIISK
jgi:alanyl-tRNA synthetase